MKIIHVIDSLGRGGAETLLVGVVRALRDHQHLIVTLLDDNDFSEELRGVEIITLGGKGPRNLLKWAAGLRKIIRANEPDVVHSHLFWSNVAARLATPASIKMFFSNHCIQSHEAFKRSSLVWLERLTYKKRHTLISVSHAVEEDYKKFIPLKGDHYVLHNFVEHLFFRQPASATSKAPPLKCVGVGRLVPQKNWAFLVQTFGLLDPALFTLDIYGKGAELPALERLMAEHNVRNVHFKGVHPAINTVLDQYDLFILSSFYEGHSVSVLEAMASSMPMLLSDIPVMREAGGNAAQYFNLSSPEGCAVLLRTLANESTMLETMGQQSYKRARQVALKDAYLTNLIGIYQGIGPASMKGLTDSTPVGRI